MENIEKINNFTLTVQELAQKLHISKSKAYQLVRGSDFPKIKIGKRLLIPTNALQTWIEQNTVYDN